MTKDPLADIIAAIEIWCEDNDLLLFYGDTGEDATATVFWKEENREWPKYLAAAKKLGIKILILNVYNNEMDTDDEEIADYQDELDEDGLEAFTDALNKVKKAVGQIVFFELIFIYDNVSYIYNDAADWYDDFQLLAAAYETEEEE